MDRRPQSLQGIRLEVLGPCVAGRRADRRRAAPLGAGGEGIHGIPLGVAGECRGAGSDDAGEHRAMGVRHGAPIHDQPDRHHSGEGKPRVHASAERAVCEPQAVSGRCPARAPVTFRAREVEAWNDTASLPLLPSDESVEVFAQLRKSPRLDLDDGVGWRAWPHRELDATNDKHAMDVESNECPQGFWPVYKGASTFGPRTRGPTTLGRIPSECSAASGASGSVRTGARRSQSSIRRGETTPRLSRACDRASLSGMSLVPRTVAQSAPRWCYNGSCWSHNSPFFLLPRRRGR